MDRSLHEKLAEMEGKLEVARDESEQKSATIKQLE